MPGKIYLIPVFLYDADFSLYLPEGIKNILQNTSILLTENAKSTRAFLKNIGIKPPYDQYSFVQLNKNTSRDDLWSVMEEIFMGKDAAMISEAGMPAVADPGAVLTKLAHEQGISIVPIPGPSSIIQALAASGLNGQQFTFHGYLPVQEKEKTRNIKILEKEATRSGYTQIFMETPYRNKQLLKSLLKCLRNDTILCMAAALNSKNENIISVPVSDWKQGIEAPHKLPAVWLIGK